MCKFTSSQKILHSKRALSAGKDQTVMHYFAIRSYQGGQEMTEHECVPAKQVHALAFLIYLVQERRSPLHCNAHKPAQAARCAGVSRCIVSLKVFTRTNDGRCHQLIKELMKP